MEEPEYNEHIGSLVVGNASEVTAESQSAQLLDFVLGRAEPPQAWNNNAQPHASDDTSSADHHSRSSGDASLPSASVAPYHFHGLAFTQTQTQVVGSEDSQKENEQAHGSPPSVPTTRNVPSRPSNCVQPAPKAPLTPLLGTSGLDPLSVRVPPPQPTKVVSFHSPSRQAPLQKAATKTSTMRYRHRPSPPIPSQDSFAGPTASQDPDLFLATSRQFEIPLDQLGRPNSQERSPAESRVGRGSVISSESTGHKPPMEDYSLSSSSSAGKILVANSDSSGPSQGSQRIELFSISQEPTQLLGNVSDASISESVDGEAATQIIDESPHVELAQAQTQEATQLLEQSPSAEVSEASVAEPSGASNALPLLSLVPPEKRHRYLHHVQEKTDARHGPSPGQTASIEAVEASLAEPSAASDRRSLLSFVPPEKRSRYMHHLRENSTAVSEASRMATAGTSLGSGNTGRLKSLLPPSMDEEVVEDSEQQIEMNILPVKGRKNRDQEVIPPSESDAPDCSKDDEQEESEEELEGKAKVPIKPPARALVKGKQKADPLPHVGSPHKPANTAYSKISAALTPAKMTPDVPTKKASAASPAKARAVTSAAPANLPAVRGKASGNSPVSTRDKEAEMAPPPEPQQEAPVRQGRRQARGATKGNAKGREEELAPPIASTSATAMQRDQRSATPAVLVADRLESEQDSPEVPLARLVNRRMEEEESEVADAEEIVVEEDEKPHIPGPARSTRKRKRRNAALTTKKSGKGKAVPRKINTRATSVAPPPTKKARTAMAKKFGAGVGTQVFALFKSDSSFYGAEVYSLSGTRAHVKFFDGLEDPNLGAAQMRRFELRKGDTVIPGSKLYKAKVIDDSLWASENEVNVEYIEGPEEGLEFTVPADGLRIPARIIQSQWKDRMLETSDIVPAVARKLLKDTPSPSKNSVLNIASSRAARNKMLSKHGIIITQGPGNHNWSREKERYINIIKDNGGTVLSDWLDILSLQGKHCNGNKRWLIQRTDVKYAPKDKSAFDRVFLISDVHNQKPKYLLALALGIPCVSVDWLDHLASGEELPWSRFLLAAGHSEPLGAPISQMVDLDWGSSAEHLTEIMENSVPQKVLSGASVLCIGSDLFPHPAKKCTSDADRFLEASRTVPRIILAMGAERVEAVVDTRNASEHLSQYTYVVVKEVIPAPRVRDVTYTDVTWIKECLIAGRLLPVPEWE